MRSHLLHRTIIGAAALTLLASSVVAAQSNTQLPTDTRFPEEVGPSLTTWVITNALDDEGSGALIADTVSAYQKELGGVTKDPTRSNDDKKKKSNERAQAQGGLMIEPPAEDTEAVTQALLDATGQYKPNLVIVSGGDGQTDAAIARSAETSVIIDLSQPVPCLTPTGQPDPTGECAGGTGALPFTYSAVDFRVEDPAFLAGIVAARLSKSSLGIIGGYEDCVECQRYIGGFINGARSVEPDVRIDIAYLADNEVDGFGDLANARTFTEAFIDIYQPDVLLPVGRAATTGMIEAACDAGIWAVGTGWDVRAERPNLECVMASVTKDLPRAVTDAMYLYAGSGTMPVMTYDLSNAGVGLTDDWRRIATLPVETDGLYQDAELALRTGQIEACPDGCAAVAAASAAADG